MKEFVVRADLEGASGVVSYDQVNEARPQYQEGRALFMEDLLALLRGLLKAGADSIVVYDQHSLARNVDLQRIPAGVHVICGKPAYRPHWAGGLNAATRGLVLLGFHSRRGTPSGLLDHSYDLHTREIRLNDLAVGEIGIEAAIAGDLGVPTILVIGDSAGIAEAGTLLPGVAGVAVKESLGHGAALCHPTPVTARWIEEAAERAVAHPPNTPPFRVQPPVTLEVELEAGPQLASLRRRFAQRFVTHDALQIRSDSVLAAWSEYLRLKEEAGC